ncbi:rhomboid family intramembrane serine protease [Desulfurococcaceae archaeon MEX13E-LK6-19]|nr:rhomboid family intramembrane serine protease [Desulfurococcaceae archaeon MEX13E-LK6-19]
MGVIPIGGSGYDYGGRPKVTYAIILINVAVYLLTSYENSFIQTSEYWIEKAALMPVLLLEYGQWYRIITSMFLHADIFHIFFNMYFLYIFGKEVEKVLGSGKYFILYFASGLAAIAFHTAFTPITGIYTVFIPALGASGAISGVLGAYLLLFPNRRMSVCWFLWIIPWCFTTTAATFLIFWFAMQVLYGYARLGSVAFFAHAGGFVMGLAALLALKPRKEVLMRPIYFYPWTSYMTIYHYYEDYPDDYYGFGGEHYIIKRGLGGTSKTILAILLVALMAGGFYSLLASQEMESGVYLYTITAGYPGGEEKTDVAVYTLSQGVVLSPVEDEPRIVLNRLDWAGLLTDDPNTVLEDYTFEGYIRTPFKGIRVSLELTANMEYDEYGVLIHSKGEMVTDVLQIVGTRVFIVKNQVFTFTIEAMGPVKDIDDKLIIPTVVPSILISLAALYAVSKKDTEIVIE